MYLIYCTRNSECYDGNIELKKLTGQYPPNRIYISHIQSQSHTPSSEPHGTLCWKNDVW